MSDSGFISHAQHEQEETLFDRGGTCDCYRLVRNNRVYCVKRPKKDMRTSEVYMSLFRKEFELGIELEHPNIVRYFAYDEDETGPFIRMDYIDGDNAEGLWRTLTIDEWNYILDKRVTPSGIRFVKAHVEGQNGLLLLPDDWDTTVFNLLHVNYDDDNYAYNNIPQPYWSKTVEAQGAVFLPAAGICDRGTTGLIGNYGFYWSSTHYDGFNALGVYFSNTFFDHENRTPKCHARSVRLVRDK